MGNERTRVLVADDHLVVREGLRLLLETEPGMDLVGEAADGEEAVARTAELGPDVVLMDLRMPRLDGIEAIRAIRRASPDTAVVILTTYDEDGLLRDGLRAGAAGYLLKDVDRVTLFRTLRAAARGETLLQAEVVARLMAGDRAEPPSRDPTGAPPLTEREREVLQAITRGERNKAIAESLGISERTVKAHLARIYAKLGVESRTAAVALALRNGLT